MARHSPPLLDFPAGARTAGAKFYYARGAAAMAEVALANFALSRAVRAGWAPVLAPDVARHRFVDGCGFHPRDADASQTYAVSASHGKAEDDALSLVATAEIPLAALVADAVHEEPTQRMVALGHCFRAEAGGTGRESRGLYRVHQFTKVELFATVAPAESDAVLAEIVATQRAALDELGLPYRVCDMPPHELGAAAARKFDIEAWMPSRGEYGEVASASNCTDFQARRLGIRGRIPGQRRPQYLHTVNGTMLAVPRVLLALIENFARDDGSVPLPPALHPFMLCGSTEIGAPGSSL